MLTSPAPLRSLLAAPFPGPNPRASVSPFRSASRSSRFISSDNPFGTELSHAQPVREAETLVKIAPLDAVNVLPGRVETRTYLGAHINYQCTANGERLLVNAPNLPGSEQFAPGAAIFLSWQPADCLVLAVNGRC